MILLIALLLAQENVTLVVKPAQKQSVWKIVGNAARRLFEKEDSRSVQGSVYEVSHDHEKALGQYDQLANELPQESGAQSAAQLDRSSALLGFASPEKAPDAASAAAKAMQHGDAEVREKGAYNLGVALEQMGKPREAMKAYQQALQLDPDDVDAKVNLELLLQTKEQLKPQPMQSEQKQQQKPQQQQSKDDQQKNQQQNSEQQQKNQQKQQGTQEEQKQAKQEQQPSEQQQAQEQKKQQELKPEKPVDRSEAERLLDALRAGEKNLQAWRFSKEKNKEAHRGDVEKDW